MKKIFVFLAFLFLLSGISAQTESGKILVSGEFGGFDSGNYFSKTGDSAWVSDYSRINFLIAPKIGYFVANGFVLGIEIRYSIDRYKFDNNNTFTAEQMGLIPFLRGYFPKGNISPFCEVGGGIYNEVLVSDISITEITTKYPGYLINAGAGVSFFAGEKTALECRIGYQIFGNKRLDSNPELSQKNMGIFLRIGASFFL